MEPTSESGRDLSSGGFLKLFLLHVFVLRVATGAAVPTGLGGLPPQERSCQPD